MKRLIPIILVCTLLLGLCACGGKEPDPSTSATTAATTTVATTQSVEDRINAAKSCIDKPVAELYKLIGQPDRFDYAPSCMGPGEDGNLYYEGFIVYTYRENGKESVYFVE